MPNNTRPPSHTTPRPPAANADITDTSGSMVRALMNRIPPKFLVPLVIIVIVAAVLLGVLTPPKPEPSSGGGGGAQPAASGACPMSRYTLAVQRECGYQTLHGLWPDPDSSCTKCSNEKFNARALSAQTLADMRSYWPTCQKGWSTESFWSWEWSKHGTCSGMSQEAYFSKALELYQKYANSSSCSLEGRGECRLCFTPAFKFQGTCGRNNNRRMRASA